jgi:hypothetical protein
MPAITRSRLDEIRSLVGDVTAAMTRRSSRGLAEKVASLARGVDEVNAALADTDGFLLAGLRDEAVSMHDPELVPIARLLDLRGRRDWVTLHGWLLEKGEPVPAPPNVEAAEQFAAAIDRVDSAEEDLATLRRLALERAPLPRRLEVLRRLHAADPTNQVWIEAIESHEEERLRELRHAVPRAVETGDLEALAELSEELADPAWDRRPPADLLPLTAGAVEGRALAVIAADADRVAAEIAEKMAGEGPATPGEIDAVAALRTRLLQLRETAENLVAELAHHPRIMSLVRGRGLDAGIRRAAEQAAAACDRIERLAAGLATKRDFTAACQGLEYLCDHLPERGEAGNWLASVQRHDLVARAACQENPNLVIPLLIRERAQRAVATVESAEHLRRRFWVVTSVIVAAAVVAIAALIGLFVWRQGAYARTLRGLEQRVGEARAGLHTEIPRDVRQAADARGDDRIAGLVEDFESAVESESRRGRDFETAVADGDERLEDLDADVGRRESGGEDLWLEAWPVSYQPAVAAVAQARRLGGLPANRGTGVEKEGGSDLTPQARQRFQEEEDRLARLEARRSELGGILEDLAGRAFTSRLERIRERMATADAAAAVRTLQSDAAALKAAATAPKVAGRRDTGPRVPPGTVANLDPVITKLEQLAREAGKRDQGDAP